MGDFGFLGDHDPPREAPGWLLWATPPLHPPPLPATGVDATFILLLFLLISALIAAGAALACHIRWVPPPSQGAAGLTGRARESLVGGRAGGISAASVSPPRRRRIQQAQLMKGPNKIILTMEDLTFIHTQSSKQVGGRGVVVLAGAGLP